MKFKLVRDKNQFVVLLAGVLIILGVFVISLFLTTSKSKQPINELDIHSDQPKIAVRKGGINNTAGDVWLLNYDGTKQKQITNTGNIQDRFVWSPDNRYIAVSIKETEKGPKGTDWYLGTVEVKTGNVFKLKNKENGEFNVSWISNDELVDLNNSQKLKTKIPEGTTIEFVENPKNGEFNSYSLLSPDKKWLASLRSPMQPEVPTITTFNLESEKFYTIVPADKARSMLDWDLGWHGNKLLYLIDQGEGKGSRAKIWQSNPDGSNKEVILDKKIDRELEDVVISIEPFNSEEFMFYHLISHSKEENSKLIMYNFVSKETKEIDLSEIIKDSGPLNNFYTGAHLGLISVSPDDKYITFKVFSEANSFVYSIELATNRTFKICENSCFNPIWSY